MEGYHHVTRDERIRIEVLRNEGVSIRGIAVRLGRAPSTISRELKRCGRKEDGYEASSAMESRKLRSRGRPPSKLRAPCLAEPRGSPEWNYVMEGFDHGWSPEQIAGRYRLEHPGSVLSHETVYRFIYAPENRTAKLWTCLPRKHKRRRIRGRRRGARAIIPGRVGIEERPIEANNRSEVGHWEGDLVCFQKTGPVILHVIERRTRFGFAIKLASKEAKPLALELVKMFGGLPRALTRTITFDNGREFSSHALISEALGMAVYFCRPYASWEKGAVENQNGLLRRYLPRWSDLSNLDQEELTDIREELNDRPMKCLGYKSPREMLCFPEGTSVALHV